MKASIRGAIATALLALLAGTAAVPAAALGPSPSPLPGFPRFGGVMLVHDGSPATKAREKAILSALPSSSKVSGSGLSSLASSTSPDCREAGVRPGRDLCWWGGPVLRSHAVHLIFWEGPLNSHPFPEGYVKEVESYFTAIASASGSLANAYAVGPQYGGQNGSGEYHVVFRGSADVYKESLRPLPAPGATGKACEDPATKGQPCITDKNLQEEIELARNAKGLEGDSWPAGLENVYFVFTPKGVGSCFFGHEEEATSKEANACAFAPGGYCAYHSDFEGGKGEPISPIYANIPDNGEVEGCDTYEHPNGAEGVDATLDSTSHEHIEMITDPIVSTGWTDVIGQEIADKCVPPETGDFELSEIYGAPLGGKQAELAESPPGSHEFTIKPGTLYNQLISGGRYWLQREWSNRAFNGEGGCVQRMLPTSFAAPAEAEATVPATFDGSLSGEAGDGAVYWVWSWGDGTQTGTPEATTAHTYANAGAYEVTLTAFDEYGNSNTHTATVSVGNAPPSPTPTTPPVNTVTVTTPATPIARYTPDQLAKLLGLPANGKRIAGLGTMLLGKAECPPACNVTLRMYAKVRTRLGRRRRTKLELVGKASRRGMPKGAVFVRYVPGQQGELLLSLSAKGRALLRRLHRLSCNLLVTVEGQEGGTWTIVRRVTLTR
jgi:PKD domain